MPLANNKIDPAIQNRLAEAAEELRALLYGEAGAPEWGTRFVDIETQDMAIRSATTGTGTANRG